MENKYLDVDVKKESVKNRQLEEDAEKECEKNKKLTHQLYSTKEELNKIKNSKSFRLMEFLLTPYRKVLNGLRKGKQDDRN